MEIYIGGRPGPQSVVSEGYSGCIGDIRLNQSPLPTMNSNEHAVVRYIGDVPDEGCRVGPCHPHPCNVGNCTESSPNVYVCSCPDGSTCTSTCDPDRNTDAIVGIAIGIAMGTFILILISVSVVGLVLIS